MMYNTLKVSSILIVSYTVPFLIATPFQQTSPQPLDQPSLIDTAPLIPANFSITTNFTAGEKEYGCFKSERNWPPTRKEDCEVVLDYWVKGQDLSLPRIFSRKSYASSRHRMIQLPFTVWDGSCRLHINVLEDDDEEALSMADVYAHVMGPDGLAKNCLGQHDGMKALGGRMNLGPRGLLSVSISGISIKSPSSDS